MSNLRKRIYDAMLGRHFESARQMAFLSGPRQVGKSTPGKGQTARTGEDL